MAALLQYHLAKFLNENFCIFYEFVEEVFRQEAIRRERFEAELLQRHNTLRAEERQANSIAQQRRQATLQSETENKIWKYILPEIEDMKAQNVRLREE